RRESSPRALKFDDTAGEFQPRPRGKLVRFENGSAEELGDKLQLIAREARQKAASLRLQWAFGTRGQSGNQDASQIKVSCQFTDVAKLLGSEGYYDRSRARVQGAGQDFPGLKD